ncbi:hypothetical protein B0H12DRAFT_1082448 [Mycena haematopus]|nr:hypothetical protein B0H12DRAFT_1082448 [Mycena haematopus]
MRTSATGYSLPARIRGIVVTFTGQKRDMRNEKKGTRERGTRKLIDDEHPFVPDIQFTETMIRGRGIAKNVRRVCTASMRDGKFTGRDGLMVDGAKKRRKSADDGIQLMSDDYFYAVFVLVFTILNSVAWQRWRLSLAERWKQAADGWMDGDGPWPRTREQKRRRRREEMVVTGCGRTREGVQLVCERGLGKVWVATVGRWEGRKEGRLHGTVPLRNAGAQEVSKCTGTLYTIVPGLLHNPVAELTDAIDLSTRRGRTKGKIEK